MTKKDKTIITDKPEWATRVVDPMESIYHFFQWLDTNPKFLNYNVRGNMITIYLEINELLAYVSLLQSRGYADDKQENLWIHRGYARGGNYFKIGPYHVRLAQYREKIHNQQDVKYLMEKHQDEVALLKKQISALQVIIEKIKAAL